jgi:AAA15 family ATPase/GTPase
MIRRKNIDTLVPLSMYGEGSIKLFRIIIEIIMCKNQFLLIDEIDSGIHFSRFRIFWKLILKTAQKYNVQIISTTHSLECLKYLKEALEDNDLKNLQSQTKHFVLRRQSDMNIKASAYNFEQFEYALDAGNEIRK